MNDTLFVWAGILDDKSYTDELWSLSPVPVDSFKYRIPITVQADQSVAGFTTYVVVNTEVLLLEGLIRSDCADIEFFTASGARLRKWLDPYPGCIHEATRYWLVLEDGRDFFMYFGKANVSSDMANLTDVFTNVEGFETQDVFQNGWQFVSSTTCFPESAIGVFEN